MLAFLLVVIVVLLVVIIAMLSDIRRSIQSQSALLEYIKISLQPLTRGKPVKGVVSFGIPISKN